MLGIAADRRRRATTPAPLLWRQRLDAGWPHARGGLNADGIGEAELRDAVTQICVVAAPRVGQHGFSADPARHSGAKLVERDLRLGLEDDLVRHPGLSAPVGIIDPLVRQIQPIGERQAGGVAKIPWGVDRS